MIRLVQHIPTTNGRGLPLLSGAIVSTGVSILLWSVLWVGVSVFR